MSYTPAVNFNRLILYLGLCGTGKAVAGSHSLTTVVAGNAYNPGTWTFDPSDAGMPIAIVGGGAIDADMPLTHFVRGALFHTTVASYVSPSEVTLTDAPITSIFNTGVATVILYRPCPMVSDVATLPSGGAQFQYSSSIAPGTSDTLQFSTFNSLGGSLGSSNPYIDRFGPPQLGQPVYLVSQDTGDMFGGYIDSLTTSSMPGLPGKPYCWSAICTSWMALAKRRVVPPFFPQTFTDIAGDQVFRNCVLDYLAEDGVAVSVSTAPDITLACAVGANVGQLLDQIVTSISTEDTAWYWTTDAWRTFILATRTGTAAPWDVTDGEDLFAGATPYSQSITATHNQMANLVYAIGSAVLLNTLNANLHGDGTATTFNLPQVVGAAPIIHLNATPQTVGVLGVDAGVDWYWAEGSAVLTQNTANPPMGATDLLEVTYQPATPAVAQATNGPSFQQLQAIEGTSAEYDHAFNVAQPILPNDLLALATAYEIEYGLPAQTVSFYTLRPGLAVGQLQNITLVTAGISGTFLIATIQMTTMDNVIVWQYTAFGGANIGNAITALTQFINRQQSTGQIITPSTPITPQGVAQPGNNAAGNAGYSSTPPLPFPEDILLGDLLWVAQNGPTTAPTDSQGNTYILAKAHGYSGGFFPPACSLWYTFATASGAASVSEIQPLIAIGKISGIDPVSPIDTTAGSDDAAPGITVGTTGNVVVTAFAADGGGDSPTVTPPEVLTGYAETPSEGTIGAAVALPAAGSFASSLTPVTTSRPTFVSVSFAVAPPAAPPAQTTTVDINPAGTVTHTVGALTANEPVFGNGGPDVKVGTKTGSTDQVQCASGSAGATGAPLLYDASGNAVAGDVEQLIPAGGTVGQVLAKNSSTNYDVSWVGNDDDIRVNGATSLNIIKVNGTQVWIGQTEIQFNGTFV